MWDNGRYPLLCLKLATCSCHSLTSSCSASPIRKAFGVDYANLLWGLLRLLLCSANRFFQLMSSLASTWYGHVLFQVCLKLYPTRNGHSLCEWDCFSCSLHVSLPFLPVGSGMWEQEDRQPWILNMQWLWSKELKRIRGLKTCCLMLTL